MKRFLQVLLALMLTVGTSAALMAKPPDPKECADGEVYDRLACMQEGIAKQLGYTSDEVFQKGSKMHANLSETHLGHLKNSSLKAERAHRKNDAKAFKRLAKAESRGNKGQEPGHLIPLGPEDDDGHPEGIASDGICDYEQGDTDAECSAIELTEYGDAQACNPEKKNKGKGKPGNDKFDGLECDRFIESEDEDEEDVEEAALQLELTFRTSQENLIDMNNHLDAVNEEQNCEDGIDNDGDGLIDDDDPDCAAVVFNGENGGSEGCDLPEPNIALRVAVIALREIVAVADGAADVTADVAGQDAAGFNALGLAVFLHAAAATANLAYIAVDEADKDENGKMQAAMMACMSKSSGQIEEALNQILVLQQQISTLQQQLKDYVEKTLHDEHEAIKANDNNNKTEIINVLNTPHGQREQHPGKGEEEVPPEG